MTAERQELDDAAFGLLVELVCRRTGLIVTDGHRSRLESLLSAEARAAGSFYELYARLREEATDGSAFGHLLDASVNGETYFFRDPHGLEAFAGEIIPERRLSVGPEGAIDVWSAGCATGEEAYTLAMVLAEKGPALFNGVRIWGTDASPAFIRAATSAIYCSHSLRQTSQDRRDQHFDQLPEGKVRVKQDIRSRVRFEARPFVLEPREGRLFDVIVCRNVLVYLECAARDRATDLFSSRLKPGGYLMLGPSDALAASVAPLTMVRLAHDVAYRK